MKITPYSLKETINLIVANANRQCKVALAEFHNPDCLHYRDFDFCHSRLESYKKEGHDRLQGIFYLLLECTSVVEQINIARNQITEECGLINALLTTGKHSKDAVLLFQNAA